MSLMCVCHSVVTMVSPAAEDGATLISHLQLVANFRGDFLFWLGVVMVLLRCCHGAALGLSRQSFHGAVGLCRGWGHGDMPIAIGASFKGDFL